MSGSCVPKPLPFERLSHLVRKSPVPKLPFTPPGERCLHLFDSCSKHTQDLMRGVHNSVSVSRHCSRVDANQIAPIFEICHRTQRHLFSGYRPAGALERAQDRPLRAQGVRAAQAPRREGAPPPMPLCHTCCLEAHTLAAPFSLGLSHLITNDLLQFFPLAWPIRACRGSLYSIR